MTTKAPKEVLFFAGTICFFPACFFMVMGYSESLFMSALMGAILFFRLGFAKQQNRFFSLAILGGIVLSATRLVGLPLFVYPGIARYSLDPSQPKKKDFWFVPFSLLFSAGGILFLIWCQYRFGYWDIYFRLQGLGWHNYPNYLAIFYPSSYLPKLFFEDTVVSVCRFSNLFVLVLFFYCLGLEQKSNWKTIRTRLHYYLLAFLLFYIPFSGKANEHMDGMVRYNLPVFAVLVFVLAELHQEHHLLVRFRKSKRWIVLGYVVALIFQLWMFHQIVKGAWVA